MGRCGIYLMLTEPIIVVQMESMIIYKFGDIHKEMNDECIATNLECYRVICQANMFQNDG